MRRAVCVVLHTNTAVTLLLLLLPLPLLLLQVQVLVKAGMTVEMMWGALTKSRIVLLDAKSPWQIHKDPGGRPYYYHNGTDGIYLY